ncbi:MAG: OmpA family protein [Nitrospira sp.]|nr:OmpA family protein [Nitrospira sp.]
MPDRIWGVSGLLIGVLTIAACAAPPAPPKELLDARLALQDAKAANADKRATRSYDSAAANLDIANKSWEKDHDESAILHQARLAEAEARKAQYAAESQEAEEAIRRETNRKNRHEIALRDAELILLKQKGQEAELERIKALSKEQEQALQNAKAKLAAERARAEQEVARLRAEHEKSKAELTATLSRLAKVREDARGVIVTLPGNIYFNFNKADVKPAMHMQLTKIAKALAVVPDQHLLIEGHTDSDGSNEYNQSLSESRAQSVRQILLDGGIPSERIEIKGYGESKPIADNDTSAGKAQNRRVEIVLLPTKQ